MNMQAEAKTTIELTPEIVAEWFWNQTVEKQADFFHALALEVDKTEGAYELGEMQWCFLKDELKKHGRELANKMHMALSAFAFEFVNQKPEGCCS